MKTIANLRLSIALGAAVSAFAIAQTPGPSGMEMKGMDMQQQSKTTAHHGTGVVKTVSKTDGVITIDHQPINSLNWSAMSMGFKPKDKSMLEQVKPGDKVDFTIVQSGKDYTITSIKKSGDRK